MLRRKGSSTPAQNPETSSTEGAGEDLVVTLGRNGWVLPRTLHHDAEPVWSLVGTVGSETSTPVDTAGLVVGEGWSLDWWIGADDRWHLPSREAAVRQQLVQDAPVVETLVRVPGGDAIHRAYGVRSPRREGDEWVVAEIENATAIPFAVTLAIRPFVADGVGAVSEITIEPTEGGVGRDVAHVVKVDGRPALVVARRPAHVAVGNAADGDAAQIVLAGRAGSELLGASCPDGLATMALVFPLTHTSVLRAAVPVGPVEDAVAYPNVLPDAATVASGWEVHRRGVRIDVPERRLAEGFQRARAHIQLASDGEIVRRDGNRSAALEPGATEVILGAYDLLDRPADVGNVVARWIDVLADASPEVDGLFLTAISRHWLLHRVDAMLDWMLPEVSAAVERIDRAHRRGRLETVAARRRAERALRSTVEMLDAAGQPEAGRQLVRLADRVGAGLPNHEPMGAVDRLLVAADLARSGDRDGFLQLRKVLDDASPTTTWAGPGPNGRPMGHDLAASAALVHAGLGMLVGVGENELTMLPYLPDDWYGAPIEVYDAPTDHGKLSWAVRWHGVRPALLWEFTPHIGEQEITLRATGFDPDWSTTEVRGDALLREIPPPRGLQRLQVVAEHPDIDPAMRKPGAEPEPPASPLPDGGSFS